MHWFPLVFFCRSTYSPVPNSVIVVVEKLLSLSLLLAFLYRSVFIADNIFTLGGVENKRRG
jgi:hypothetical protein